MYLTQAVVWHVVMYVTFKKNVCWDFSTTKHKNVFGSQEINWND